MGIAATGFCYPGGILQLFHRRYQQIFHRQDQQILRLPTAAAARSLQQIHPLQIDLIINKEGATKLRDYGVDKSSRH
jgi:hypothetical protein